MRHNPPLPRGVTDETGHTYGRLTVVEFAGIAGKAMWHCLCECGKGCTVRADKLRTGATVSCGCWRRDPDVRQAARLKVPRSHRAEIAAAGGRARRIVSPAAG
jgi:hypothetical protein